MNKLLAIIFFFSSQASAQEIQSYVINSCGEHVTPSSASFKMRTSVGEPIVGTHRGANVSLKQGFLHNIKKTTPPSITPGIGGVFPNPTDDILFIKPNIARAYQLKLINAMGQCMATFRIVNNSISLRGIAPGFYVVLFLDAKGQVLENHKLIKR